MRHNDAAPVVGQPVRADELCWTVPPAVAPAVDLLTLTDEELFARAKELDATVRAVRAVLSEALSQLAFATAHLAAARLTIHSLRAAQRAAHPSAA